MKKSVVSVMSILAGVIMGVIGTRKTIGKKIVQNEQMSDKHLALFLMMNQWVKVKQEGKNIASYFSQNGYHKIAIYGMSYAGETLVEELNGSDIEISYGIDRNADNIYAEFDVVFPDSELREVDVIVVTSIKFFDEIEEFLSEKVNCPILSLEDILYEV